MRERERERERERDVDRHTDCMLCFSHCCNTSASESVCKASAEYALPIIQSVCLSLARARSLSLVNGARLLLGMPRLSYNLYAHNTIRMPFSLARARSLSLIYGARLLLGIPLPIPGWSGEGLKLVLGATKRAFPAS